MQFKNFVPYFFRNGFHHFLEVNNFVLMLIGGEKVNFVIINKRFSQNVHNCVGFSAATLAGDKQAENLHPRNCKGFFPVGRFCIIIWNLHFKC